MDLVNQGLNGDFVEVYVGDGCEQSLDHQLADIFNRLRGAVRRTGKTDQCAGQLILQSSDIRCLSADAGLSHAALTACGLLTLKTKHLRIHFSYLLILLRWHPRGNHP